MENVGILTFMETVKRISNRWMPKLFKNFRIYSLHKIISMDRKYIRNSDRQIKKWKGINFLKNQWRLVDQHLGRDAEGDLSC